MNRRVFLRLSLAGALAAPVLVPAQTASRRIGFVFGESRSAITDGWRESTSSTSSEEMFSPPEMITSFDRSLIST